MKTHSHIHDPELRIFFRFFGFTFGVMLFFVAGMYLIFDFGAPVKDYLKSVGFMLFLYPFINSLIGTYGARKYTFTISAIDDPALVAGWVVALLQKNDMHVVAEQHNQTILEPTGRFLKWYGKKFGTGLAAITWSRNEVTIAGSSKAVDIVDTKIKFGRVDFTEQPYKHS